MTTRKTKKSAPAKQGASVFVITKDPAVAKAVRSAAKDAAVIEDFAAAAAAAATGARVGLVDAAFPAENAYEILRKLRTRTPLRMALLHPDAKKMDSGLLALARFAGAETILSLPPTAAELNALLKPRKSVDLSDSALLEKEHDAARSGSFQARVLRDVLNPSDPALLDAICDPETRLFSSAYGAHAFDWEYKRSQRFGLPLTIAIVGFEGEASREVLLELAAIFLNEIRDTDMLARFDVNTFFFVMPNTLAEGSRAMLERIAKSVTKRGLLDIVGDPVQLASGVAGMTMPASDHRSELFARAKKAFERARAESVAAIVA